VPKNKLILVHHFPLASVTGVTVMLAQLLKLVPSIAPDTEVLYWHYGLFETPDAIESAIGEVDAERIWVFGVNLQIEVQWEWSLALARACARRSILLFNNVQDYWPHHEENMRQLTKECGVRLLGASPFLVDSLAKDNFAVTHLQMGAQLPAVASPHSPVWPKMIGSVGRLVRRKRFADTVRAFCSAGLDKTAQLRLTLVPSEVFGAERDAEQLRLICNEIEKPGIQSSSILLGTTPIVPPDYASLSIFVSASDYEGFSLTPYEAAFSGCPPIVSNIPPHEFMARSLFGDHAEDFLFPVTDTDALAECLQDEITTGRRRLYLLENHVHIRDLIETHYSFQTTAKALVQVYEESKSHL
jgi:glycosyltransferase involved in cell wall biosynthesis